MITIANGEAAVARAKSALDAAEARVTSLRQNKGTADEIRQAERALAPARTALSDAQSALAGQTSGQAKGLFG